MGKPCALIGTRFGVRPAPSRGDPVLNISRRAEKARVDSTTGSE